MKYLRKIWVRVVVSLIGGGIVMETLHITTGDPNRPMESNLSSLFAVIIFAGIGFYIRVVDWKRLKDID